MKLTQSSTPSTSWRGSSRLLARLNLSRDDQPVAKHLGRENSTSTNYLTASY